MNEKHQSGSPATEAWPEDGLEWVESCPVCGSPHSDTLHTGLTDRIFFCAPGNWTMFRCTDCGAGYLNPRPTQDTIDLAYRSYFTHERENSPPPMNSTGFAKIRRALGNGYRNWRFGTRYKPATRAGIPAVLINPARRASIDASMCQLPYPREDQTLLDFGCGNGSLMTKARDAGWHVIGLDFDAEAVKVAEASGLEAYLGGIDTLCQWQTTFDVITLSHVVEHVHDPEALLKACCERLKPGGFLWIETPNLDSQGHKVYGSDWRDLDPPRHLVLFTPKTLFQLLIRCGFVSIRHQVEHPTIPAVFGASEAIRAGEDPIEAGPRWARSRADRWKQARKHARDDPNVREFITIVAHK